MCEKELEDLAVACTGENFGDVNFEEDEVVMEVAGKNGLTISFDDIIQDCVQLHGGIGVTWEHDIHLYLRRATVNRGLFGTPNDHRERLAALVGIKRKDETT